MRKSAAAVGLAALVFGCGGDWFGEKRPQGVELLIEGLQAPAWADWEETIQVKNTIYNWGTTQVGVRFTVNFYLSQDARYGGTDVLLGSRQIDPPFAGGGRDTDDTSLTLPTSGALPDGPYYIIAYVDQDNRVDEIEGGENDNITAAGPMMVYTPPVGIDLITKYVSGPSGAEWSDWIQLDYTVRNRGTVNCGSFQVSFYLSVDRVFDGGFIDTLLGTDTVSPNLPAQTEYTDVFSVQVPPSGTDGSYYIIGVANDPFSIVEVSGNMANDKASDATIYVANLSDLIVSSVSLGASPYYWGDQVSVTALIREDRGFPSPPGTQIQVQLWLSEDSVFSSATDLLLASVQTGPLSAFGSTNVNANVILTKGATWTNGTHWIIAYVDPLDRIPEDNESNNTRPRSLSINDAPTDAYEPNDSLGTAYSLGSDPYLTLYAYIRPQNDEDWYSFIIPYSGYYYIDAFLYPPFDQDYDLYVYQPGGSLLQQSVNTGNGVSEIILRRWGHPAGTYYIRVKGKSSSDWGNSTYRLVVHIW